MMNIETLAKLLHEAGREAVLANKVHKKDGAPVGQIVFVEWDQLSDDAREGRRIQARYLNKVLFHDCVNLDKNGYCSLHVGDADPCPHEPDVRPDCISFKRRVDA